MFVLLVAVALVMALLEFWLLARKQQIRADPVAGLLGAAALFTVFYFTEPRRPPDLLVMVIVLILQRALPRKEPVMRLENIAM